MSVQITNEAVTAWLANPLVNRAAKAAHGDMRQTLLGLHDMLTTLEERAPGVPFAELLPESNCGQTRSPEGCLGVVDLLFSQGYSLGEVDELVPGARTEAAQLLYRRGDSISSIEDRLQIGRSTLYRYLKDESARRQFYRAEGFRKFRSENPNLTLEEAADAQGISARTAYRYMNVGEEPRPCNWQQVGQYMLDHGLEATKQRFGVKKSYIYTSAKRVRDLLETP